MIQLSIAIVTRNRSQSLGKTLSSLFQQKVAAYEVIISDDSNQPVEIEANKKLAEAYHCKYVSGPQNGLYANRNFVAKQCSGTHIRSMDDDHEFPENHLEACFSAIESEPNTIWTIGEYKKDEKNLIEPYPTPGQLHPRGYSYMPEGESEYYGISCGATLYPKKLIDLDILNTDFYKFGILYLEYGARLKYLGYTLKILTTTYIIHDDTATTASQLNLNLINEARVFSMLCLSFKYQRRTKNMILTSYEVLRLLLNKKIATANIISAYKNFKLLMVEIG